MKIGFCSLSLTEDRLSRFRKGCILYACALPWQGRLAPGGVENRIYVLHCFEKESRKTDRRDIAIASQRLKLVRQRLKEQKGHEKRSGK
jgi:hypothetical protein